MFRKIIILIFITYLILYPNFALAEDLSSDLQDKQSELNRNKAEQDRLKRELAKTQSQEKNLFNQISYLDNQILLTQLEIEEKQNEINQKQEELQGLVEEINELQDKIAETQVQIEETKKLLQIRIRSSYKSGQIGSVPLLVGGEGDVEDLVLRLKYLQAVQIQDKKVLGQLETLKNDLQSKKENLEVKRQEVEQLKNDLEVDKLNLEAQTQDLDFQKSSKEYLLEVTQNSEEEYQSMLAQYRAEQAAIQGAINSLVNKMIAGSVTGQEVKKGQAIGIQGRTGLATGDHLHFGVYVKCGNYWCHTNPMSYLNSGQLSWPMVSYNISQGYGVTEFARASGFYANDFHNGVDMYSDYGAPILAAQDGKINYTVDAYGGKGALIYHSDNLMTLYWHLQ